LHPGAADGQDGREARAKKGNKTAEEWLEAINEFVGNFDY